MENNTCHWCSKEFEPKLNNYRRIPRFCSDECRYSYHNELKRIKLQHTDLIREALRLNDNLVRGGEVSKASLRVIQSLLPCLSAVGDVTCAKCGQKRMFIPQSWDTCSFCHEKEWIFKPREEKEPISPKG